MILCTWCCADAFWCNGQRSQLWSWAISRLNNLRSASLCITISTVMSWLCQIPGCQLLLEIFQSKYKHQRQWQHIHSLSKSNLCVVYAKTGLQCKGRCGVIPRGAHHTCQLEVAAVASFLSHLLVQHDQASWISQKWLVSMGSQVMSLQAYMLVYVWHGVDPDGIPDPHYVPPDPLRGAEQDNHERLPGLLHGATQTVWAQLLLLHHQELISGVPILSSV